MRPHLDFDKSSVLKKLRILCTAKGKAHHPSFYYDLSYHLLTFDSYHVKQINRTVKILPPHTHSHILSLSHTHSHSLTHAHTLTHTLSLSHTHTLSFSLSHTHTLSLSLTQNTHTHSHTHSHTHYLSLTHTLTHSLSLSLSLSHTHTQRYFLLCKERLKLNPNNYVSLF